MKKYTASIEAQHKGADPVMQFVMCLLHSVTNAHILHLSTTSYAAHKALENFYTEIGDHVDDFVEAFQGKYGLLTDYKADYALPQEPVTYLTYLKDEVATLRKEPQFPQDSELQNITDEVAQLIDSTLYKLRFLK
jgi:DNA-binding ferritin-like protein